MLDLSSIPSCSTYVEELVSSLLESVSLTIVDKHGALIDHGHVREALLRVQECVQGCSCHACAEECNHSVILLHRVLRFVLLSGAAANGYKWRTV